MKGNPLFIFCILIRFLFVVFLYYTFNIKSFKLFQNNYINIFWIFTLIISISWLYLYIFNKRLYGREVIDGNIWWTKYRIIHSLLYLICFILIYYNNKISYIPLLIDVVFGSSLFIKQYFYNN